MNRSSEPPPNERRAVCWVEGSEWFWADPPDHDAAVRLAMMAGQHRAWTLEAVQRKDATWAAIAATDTARWLGMSFLALGRQVPWRDSE